MFRLPALTPLSTPKLAPPLPSNDPKHPPLPTNQRPPVSRDPLDDPYDLKHVDDPLPPIGKEPYVFPDYPTGHDTTGIYRDPRGNLVPPAYQPRVDRNPDFVWYDPVRDQDWSDWYTYPFPTDMRRPRQGLPYSGWVPP